MKEKINITIENIDDLQSVLKSLELLFEKLILYYSDTDLQKLSNLILSCSVYFGRVLRLLGYTEEDFKG
jgi:hypothetical protein